MTFKERVQKDRRLIMLRFLAEAAGYTLNTSVLQSAMDAYGHDGTRDQINTDAAWLDEQGLVHMEQVDGRVTVLKLTARGLDVAEGRTTVPGVAKPRPGV